MLECIEVETHPEVSGSVIWLHGLGADGFDFSDIVPQLNLPANLALRFLFPHAPVQSVTLNAGMRMRAWYDVVALDANVDEDLDGILRSKSLIEALISQEINRGIQPNRIVLIGFSQGGAMVLYTGLRYPKTLAGIMGLSSYLPMSNSLASEASASNRQTPIFLGHGTQDPVVNFQWGLSSAKMLQSLGYPVSWHTYPMMHNVCMEEIQDISQFLIKILVPTL